MAKRWKRKRWGKEYVDNRDWKETNEKYVKRGEFYFTLEFLDSWDSEIAKMNKCKKGRPFEFPDQFIKFMMLVHIMFSLPYRQCEGFIRKLSTFIPQLGVADYTTIFKRGTKLEIPLKDTISSSIPKKNNDDDVIISIDSSGIKVTNRGEWIREKWKIHRGWIKVHIAVNIKTKEVVGLEITDERTGDSKVFGKLIDEAENNIMGKGRKIRRALADGSYDTKEDFNKLEEKGIEPGIKIRSNASTRARGSPYRAKHVREYKELGYDNWKEKYGYGYRWSTEGVFSAVKRITGEHVRSTKPMNMFREVAFKFMFYNMLINAC